MDTDLARPVGVFMGPRQVGWLATSKSNQMSFRYHPEWLKSGYAISQSLPLTEHDYDALGHNFFGNLLPEGDYRRRIETHFQVSEGNDDALLRILGGDCAGALTIGAMVDRDEASYEPISAKSFQDIIKTEGINGLKAALGLRPSLAGAQGKIPLLYEGGRFHRPLKGAASSHIIKFNRHSGEYPKLVENEYFMNRIAHHLGLHVVHAFLLQYEGKFIYVTERYDRYRDESGWWHRIHQEDFCQAKGYSYHTKYQNEGGPGIKACAELIRRFSLLDVQQFIDWIIFNFLLSNADNHGKNLSILYTDPQKPRLAPFYDLICTRAYDKLDRRMAMAIGGEYDPDLIKEDHLMALALELGVTWPFLTKRFVTIAKAIEPSISKAESDLQKAGVRKPAMQQTMQQMIKFYKRRRKLADRWR